VIGHGWCGATKCCITRDWKCLRAIQCLLKQSCERTLHERVGGRPESDEAVSAVRAPRARVGGFQGCSIDNKLVAEIGERHLLSFGLPSLTRKQTLR